MAVPRSNMQGYRCKPLIMGILNVTPDSFSDGGRYMEPSEALRQAEGMISHGADIIDIGGESSRPGAVSVSMDEELSRVIPVIERIRQNSDICISIDTCKADVMHAAVEAGASFINDITALRGEGALAMAVSLDVPVCLMHMLGSPLFMQDNPGYVNNVVDEINQFFHQRIETCIKAGMARERLIIDPGFGFGKSTQDNLMIIRRLADVQRHNLPILLGVSRKSTIGVVLQNPVSQRLIGGIAIAIFAALQGVALIRTHDVDETNQALRMLDSVCLI